ncbi:MAG TPA: hypothetical protein VMB84_19280, partial [Stellaceae bacterium]|nr:hypothetical protein [Stellaceae bacterium]
RAAHLAARGAAVVLAESELSPASLAAALDRAAAGEPRPVALDTDGATASAAIIVALAGK